MSDNLDKKMKFKAVDEVSSVIDRISSKFPKLSKEVEKTYNKFERAQKSSAKLRASLSSMGASMKSIGATMTASITLPVVAFGMQAYETSRVFDYSMNKVQALTGATGVELESLRTEAKLLGATTAFSATQAADAMAFFGQAGWNTNQILKATGPTLALAAASSTDLAMSADIMSNIMGGFAITADEAGRAADVLARGTAKGNITLEMIGETMKDAAPVAQKYGASLEEVTALTAKLGDAGIQGSKAGTTLKNMFLNLTAATPAVQKVMKELGVKAIDPSTGKMRKMTDILVDLNNAFEAKGLGSAKKLAVLNEIFGLRAVAGAGVLINAVSQIDPVTGKAVNAVAMLEEQLMNSTGAAKHMQDTMEKGLPGAVNTFKSSYEAMQIAVMDSGLKDALANILNAISKFFLWVSNLNPAILKWGSIILLVVAALGPMIFILGAVISALPFIISGLEALALIFPVLQIGMLPFLLLMAKFLLIAGLIAAAAYLIYDNWAGISDFFVGLFQEPLKTIKDMVNWASKLVGIGSIFGKGPDDVDADLKKQGFTISGPNEAGPRGKESGSEDLTKKNFEFISRKQQASVDVKFSNMPQGTKVMSEDKNSILNIDTGMMGAM